MTQSTKAKKERQRQEKQRQERQEKAKNESDYVRRSLRSEGSIPEFPEGMADTRAPKKKPTPPPPPIPDEAYQEDETPEKLSSSTPADTSNSTPIARKITEELVGPSFATFTPLTPADFDIPHYREKEESTNTQEEDNIPKYKAKISDDPEPIPEDSTEEEKSKYKQEVINYTKAMYDTYKEINLEAEELWEDFVTAFRPESILLWNRETTTKWHHMLRNMECTSGQARRYQSLSISSTYCIERSTTHQ